MSLHETVLQIKVVAMSNCNRRVLPMGMYSKGHPETLVNQDTYFPPEFRGRIFQNKDTSLVMTDMVFMVDVCAIWG